MKTKKSSFDICHDTFEYQNALSNLILTQFNKEIKYDYTIPPPSDVLKIVMDSLKQWETHSQLKKDISEIVEEGKDDESILRRHLWNDQSFGHEWFYGFGDFFRYRKEEKAKAISSVYSNPKLADSETDGEPPKPSKRVWLKKDTQKFAEILYKNIKKFYKKWEKE